MATHDEVPLPNLLNARGARRQFRVLFPLFALDWYEAMLASQDPKTWQEYFSVLLACQVVLDHAPMYPSEIKQINVEQQLERALKVLATALHQVLPASLLELDYYIADQGTVKRRRRSHASRARQARKKYRKRIIE